MQFRTAPSEEPKELLPGLKAVLDKARIKNCIPGMSIAVMYKGEVIFAEGYGKRNETQPFTKDTVSTIYSLTKAFTATAVGELVAEGKVDWNTTPINTYLPEFELKDPVLTSQLTFADLLSHNTTIPSLQTEISWIRNEEPRRELIKRLRHADMTTKPSPYFNYSNVMYSVAGEAAANVAGVSYEQLVEQKIFKPLGLTNTGFSQIAMKKLPNHAAPYYAESFEKGQRGEFKRCDYDLKYFSVSPAGGITSTVLDLVRWGKVVIDGGMMDGVQVLNKEAVEMTLTPRTIMLNKRTPEFPQAVFYCLGWVMGTYRGHNHFRHSGGYPGYGSSIAIFPDDDIVVATLCNVQSSALLGKIHLYVVDELLGLPTTQDWLFTVSVEETREEIKDEVDEAVGNMPPQIADRPSSHTVEELIGEYDDPLYGSASVLRAEAVDGGEEGQNSKGDLEFVYHSYRGPLTHYHFDSFKAVIYDFGRINFTVPVTFETGFDGRVSGLCMDIGEEKICWRKVRKGDEGVAKE